jgi:hypothetical protein
MNGPGKPCLASDSSRAPLLAMSVDELGVVAKFYGVTPPAPITGRVRKRA